MKPIFENDIDAENEARVAGVCERKWQCKLFRQKRLAQFDYVAVRGGEVLCFVEMRSISYKMADLPHIMISMTKLIAAKTMGDITGKRHLFVVDYQDGIRFADLNQFMASDIMTALSPANANRRNDHGDREVVALIPNAQFKLLEEK